MAGRRTILTREMIDRIAEIMAAGNYICVACDYLGISKGSYHAWVVRGEKEAARIEDGGEPDPDEAIFVEFLNAVTRARSRAEIQSVARIRKAAEEDWKADAWYLERSHLQRWGRTKVDVEHSGTIERKVYHVRFEGDPEDEDDASE
jgi:hypothetical protein